MKELKCSYCGSPTHEQDICPHKMRRSLEARWEAILELCRLDNRLMGHIDIIPLKEHRDFFNFYNKAKG